MGIEDTEAYLSAGVDIEDIHSEIANRLASVEKQDGGIDRTLLSKPYNQLMFLFTTILNEIAYGPTSQSHIDLAGSLRPDDVVVTFNWVNRLAAEIGRIKSIATRNWATTGQCLNGLVLELF